ncbi:hypothetical protein RIF29_35365 [Crotalaria pallida]|uniref:Uncharacterized protein n=1 Tax=Crotalaria pallida TaxID=3830 RepID=A0AAN9ECF3_CROPI
MDETGEDPYSILVPPGFESFDIDKVSYCKDKAALVRVYVEKPRKKKSSSIQHHHHHHYYHIHQTLRQEVVHVPSRQGHDRRAGLLMYSHHLRQSARGASSTPLLSQWSANNTSIQCEKQMAPSKKKPKNGRRPACFGNWKQLIPIFLRSRSSAPQKDKNKKQNHSGFLGNAIKILQVRRGRSFIRSMFSTTKRA